MNRHSFITASMLAMVSIGCNADVEDPAIDAVTQPIVGGEDVTEGTMPYMVGIFDTLYEADPADLHFCGGTLIDAATGLVVTAAHCVAWEIDVEFSLCDGDPECMAEYDTEWVDRAIPPEWIQVTVGSRALSAIAPDDYLTVTEVIVHPEYDGYTIENDIALLRVAGVDPQTPTPRWIGETPFDPWLLFPGRRATVAGWGSLSEEGGYPDVLQSVDVPVLHGGLCRALMEHVNQSEIAIAASMLCAGTFRGGRDACGGDSGGPLTVRGFDGRPVLAGVVSWGEGCARPLSPGVYANVLNLRPWTASCEADGDPACERLPEIPAFLVDELF